jgi:hypothetical protein
MVPGIGSPTGRRRVEERGERRGLRFWGNDERESGSGCLLGASQEHHTER